MKRWFTESVPPRAARPAAAPCLGGKGGAPATGAEGAAFFGDRRGSALLMAVWIVGILGLLALGLAFDAHMESRVSAFARRRQKAEALALSGLTVAEMLLQKQANLNLNETEDGIEKDKWYGPAFKLAHGQPISGMRYPLGEGEIIIDIAPEPGRRNVNRLTDEDWERILTVGGIPQEYWEELIDSVNDWIDEDSIANSQGAEKDYYEELDPPYTPRNGPLDSVQELLLVKGFSKAVLSGGILNPDDPADSQASASGIQDLLTTYGDGKVNVNAADMRTLMTLPGVDEIIAGAIIEERTQRSDSTTSGIGRSEAMAVLDTIRESAYKTEADFINRIPEIDGPQLRDLISVKSDYFRVTAVGRVGNTARRVWAILQVDGENTHVLRWREEI